MYIIFSKIIKVNESWVDKEDKFCQKLATSEAE